MAERLGLFGHDRLQHFVASPAWDDGPFRGVLARQADRLSGGPDAFLVIDDTALPKKGTPSAGVARQYCGRLGKQANCQSLVSLILARDEVPVMVGLRLFLSDEWSNDAGRRVQAGVLDACMAPKSKGQIALDELDRVRAASLRFGTVLADASYGVSIAFRHGLDQRGLAWAVGDPQEPEGLRVRGAAYAPWRAGAQAGAGSGTANGAGRGDATAVATGELARRNKRKADGPVRCLAHPGGGGCCVEQQPPSARRGRLAGRRVALDR